MCICMAPVEVKHVVIEELYHWKKCDKRKEVSRFDIFSGLMLERKEYRSLLQYRFNRGGAKLLLKILFPGMETLYINTSKIGPRLFIQHGFATNISAKQIGSDCWINQQVTIGYNGQGNPPIIGNNVMITCGAKVLGNITVGDDSVIGANAVVINDVEPGAIMGGIPAKKIK